MSANKITVLGQTNFRNVNKKFGIKVDDRRRHMYVIGKTGMGKTNFLESTIIQDIWAGNGVAVIDPHGDMAEKVLQFIPNNRINDVIYFNPADIEFPIAFNVLGKVEPRYRHLVSSGLVGVFKKMWADSWGPRLEYLLRNAILALLEFPDSTMLGITRMMVDKEFREKVVNKVTDPVVKSFWVNEFAKYTDKFANEAIAPIQNKVGQFLSVSLIRNIVGQVKSSFDIRHAMDTRKILLVNLSKGRIGEDISAMLGAMMITKIYLSAMSRVDIPEDERKDFYLYVDEFQNFATDSFKDILSEARKYHLCLTVAHQYIEQLDESVKYAILGNVGTLTLFRIGATDAELLIKEFEPTYTEADLINLPKYNIYLKLMIDGVASDPFSAQTLPPFPEEFKTNNVDKIISVSRERYARSRDSIEAKIRRWSGIEEAEAEATAAVEEEEINSQAIKIYDSSCFSCGITTKTLFEPDGVRPIYCPECLRLVRKGYIKQVNKMSEVPQRAKIVSNIQKLKDLNQKKNEVENSRTKSDNSLKISINNNWKNNSEEKTISSKETISLKSLLKKNNHTDNIKHHVKKDDITPAEKVKNSLRSNKINHFNKIVADKKNPEIKK